MAQREKPSTKKVVIIVAVVLGVCLLIGAGIWFYQGNKAKSAFESDLKRITAEDVIFVSMSYTDTPSFASYGTQDVEQMKDAIGWIQNAGFHTTISPVIDWYVLFPNLRPTGGIHPGYTFTLRDGSKLHIFYLGSNRVEYNGWIYSVDDTGLAAKFRALYDSVKDNAQTYPHNLPSAA